MLRGSDTREGRGALDESGERAAHDACLRALAAHPTSCRNTICKRPIRHHGQPARSSERRVDCRVGWTISAPWPPSMISSSGSLKFSMATVWKRANLLQRPLMDLVVVGTHHMGGAMHHLHHFAVLHDELAVLEHELGRREHRFTVGHRPRRRRCRPRRPRRDGRGR